MAQEPESSGLAPKNPPGRALPPAFEPTEHTARPSYTFIHPVSACTLTPSASGGCSPVCPWLVIPVHTLTQEAPPDLPSSLPPGKKSSSELSWHTASPLTSAPPASVCRAGLPPALRSFFWGSGRLRSLRPYPTQQDATHENLGPLVTSGLPWCRLFHCVSLVSVSGTSVCCVIEQAELPLFCSRLFWR